MPIQKNLTELIHAVLAVSSEIPYVPQTYEKLADRHGFHSGGEWIKKQIKKTFLDFIFRSENPDEIYQSLRRFGKIRFDLDGLKSINDFGNHRLGDILLDLAAQAMCNQRVSHFCQLFSLTMEVARAGGDEFDFFVERTSGGLDEEVCYEMLPNTIVTLPVIFLLRDLIILEVSLSPFPQMDFHSLEIQERLGEYGRSLLEKTEKYSGEKFFFTPSVSAGECVFWDILLRFMENNPGKNISMEKFGDILMGMVEDVSGDLITKRKAALRKALWNSPSPKKNMQALLITRSQTDKETAIFLHRLRYLNKCRDSLFSEIYALQSLRDCALAETAQQTASEMKVFLREIEDCIFFVRDKLFSLDGQIRKLLR